MPGRISIAIAASFGTNNYIPQTPNARHSRSSIQGVVRARLTEVQVYIIIHTHILVINFTHLREARLHLRAAHEVSEKVEKSRHYGGRLTSDYSA